MPCFAALGEQTATQLRERFQQGFTHSLVAEHVDRLIETSLGSSWTRLYDSVSLPRFAASSFANTTSQSINTIRNLSFESLVHLFRFIFVIIVYMIMRAGNSETMDLPNA